MILIIEFIKQSDLVKLVLGFIFVFAVVFLTSFYQEQKYLKMIRNKIKNMYGTSLKIEEFDANMKSVSSFFRNIGKISGIIDDITWNDLNMDDVYKKLNNTQSTAGREILYKILRENDKSVDELDKRDKLIEYFRNNEKDRFNVQYILAKLGISSDLYVTNCLYNDRDDSKSKLAVYNILAFAPLILLVVSIFNKWFLVIVILSLILNISLSMRNKSKNFEVNGYSYMIKVVNTANSIYKLGINILDVNFESVREDLNKMKNIRRKNIGKNPTNVFSEANIFYEYTNLIFLRELRSYEDVKEIIIKNSDKLKRIYSYIGEIDALIAISSFRESLEFYSTPLLINGKKLEGNTIDFEEIYHPLIKNPVVNSGTFKKGCLITGSNASGKSTFIKTIAINAILAQTIYTTCSKKYISSIFNIYSSMALKDDILNEESYFMVEIKSLKRIVDNLDNKKPILCFVDEILRGTNTVERIASSCEVLRYLSKGNCLCFAATHDIELTYLLEDRFDNYHFEENITSKDIEFDYKLHRGRAESKNAIKLLEFMGYNNEIVSKSMRRANNFMELGKWEV